MNIEVSYKIIERCKEVKIVKIILGIKKIKLEGYKVKLLC